MGGYAADQAARISESLLPDILTYDSSKPSGYPNGRGLKDDIMNLSLAMLTNGAVSNDGLLPHEDLLAEFPYLGDPH
ncbi:MAG TPA: DUF4331 family protein [Candidatus Sulfotelmatobacter sp.]|nr:DUF4331 family protein [Candidatus Sulfotelmatobacter sp.]